MKIEHAGLPLPESVWAHTAAPATRTPPLNESITVDVAIVGAGYTGLSTALHLAEAGVACCVLEASEPGWGASGRNGGQVIPLLKYEPDEIERMFGTRQGALLNDAVQGSADLVFDLIERHGIACEPVRKGWLQLAHTPKAVTALHARAAQWRRRGVAAEALDGEATRQRVGSESFLGAWRDPRAGAIQPLAYARGLASAAQALGAQVHGKTLVTSLRRVGPQWEVATAPGPIVRASQVVLATNGYTGDLWPGVRQSVLAANSFIIATEPLSDTAGPPILPGGEVASSAQRLLLYFRRDAQGRLLVGGRGSFADPGSPEDFAHLQRALRQLFPRFGPMRLQFRWAGRIAITRDFLPHVHAPAPGVWMALGYNGRGIACATMVGRHLAARLQGAVDFPLPITPIRPIPLHGMQRLYIGAGVAWYSLLDRIA